MLTSELKMLMNKPYNASIKKGKYQNLTTQDLIACIPALPAVAAIPPVKAVELAQGKDGASSINKCNSWIPTSISYVYDASSKDGKYQNLSIEDLGPMRQQIHKLRCNDDKKIFNNILFTDIINDKRHDDSIWTNKIMTLLKDDECIALGLTCHYFNDLSNRQSKVLIDYWQSHCKSILRIPFLLNDYFEPLNNNWKQFYIQLKRVLGGLKWFPVNGTGMSLIVLILKIKNPKTAQSHFFLFFILFVVFCFFAYLFLV